MKTAGLKEDLIVFVVLLALFGLSLAVAFADWGPASTAISFAISSVKVAVLAWYFMHLRSEKGVTRVFAGVGFAWLFILLTLTLSDYVSRGWLPFPAKWPVIVRLRPGLEENYAPDEQTPPRPGSFGIGR